MVLLQSMQDGYLFSDILLKMYLKSLKSDGRLMFKDKIPYNANMIATVTKHQVGTVEKALNIFEDLGLIDVLDNKAIYMLEIQTLIGEGSSEADRKKTYRERIKHERQLLIEGGQTSDFRPPEIEIDKELDLELEKEKTITSLPSANTPILFDDLDARSKAFVLELERTGRQHRKIFKLVEWDDILDLEIEEFREIARQFIEDANYIEDLNIDYFNSVCHRYK